MPLKFKYPTTALLITAASGLTQASDNNVTSLELDTTQPNLNTQTASPEEASSQLSSALSLHTWNKSEAGNFPIIHSGQKPESLQEQTAADEVGLLEKQISFQKRQSLNEMIKNLTKAHVLLQQQNELLKEDFNSLKQAFYRLQKDFEKQQETIKIIKAKILATHNTRFIVPAKEELSSATLLTHKIPETYPDSDPLLEPSSATLKTQPSSDPLLFKNEEQGKISSTETQKKIPEIGPLSALLQKRIIQKSNNLTVVNTPETGPGSDLSLEPSSALLPRRKVSSIEPQKNTTEIGELNSFQFIHNATLIQKRAKNKVKDLKHEK